MPSRERFAYLPTNSPTPSPWLPLSLLRGEVDVAALGLVDSGAAVSVLPYLLGIQLGLDWGQQAIPLRLTGNLANLEARAVTISARVGSFAPRTLTFAWTRAEAVPLILGQVNFFLEFDVFFFRSRRCFEVGLAGDPGV